MRNDISEILQLPPNDADYALGKTYIVDGDIVFTGEKNIPLTFEKLREKISDIAKSYNFDIYALRFQIVLYEK